MAISHKTSVWFEPIPKPIWVTPNEAVRLSGIGRTMLYELIAAGRLKSIKIQGKRLISFASLEELGSFRLR
jgi:excisionase family DNA binding protein